MDKWYEADICDYQNLIRTHALNYEFDLDKNYLIMKHTDSRHLIRGSMTKISIWNLGSGFDAIVGVYLELNTLSYWGPNRTAHFFLKVS